MFKKILTAFLAVVLLLVVALPIGVSAAGEKPHIQTSDVLDDLKSMSTRGKKFSINDYPANPNDDTVRLISFIEYGYSQNGNHGDYNLYLYLYNPSMKPIYQHSDNKVQLSFGDVDRYEKYGLKIIDSTTDNLFYKMCLTSTVTPSTGISIPYSSNMSSIKRVYKISGIELMTDRSDSQKDFKIGGTYTYTGFGQGFRKDPTAKSTLRCEAEDMLTVSLDLNYTYFRPKDPSTAGNGHRNDLNTVYFTVPNSIWEDYGYLYSIEGEYYEYRIASIVSENQEAIEQWEDDIGKALSSVDGYSSGRVYERNFFVYEDVDININHKYTYSFGFNVPSGWVKKGVVDNPFSGKADLSAVPYMFYSNKIVSDEVVITSAEILRAVQDHGLYGVSENDGKLVQYSKKFNDSFDLDTYDVAGLDFWSNIWYHLGLLAPTINADYQEIPAIQDVKYNERSFLNLSDQEIADLYYVNLADVPAIRRTYSAAAAKGENLVFLHFDVSDSFTAEMKTGTHTTNVYGVYEFLDDLSYYYEQSYYKDFDVLSLTFTEDYVEFTVIPTSADPQDFVADQTPSLNDDKFELPGEDGLSRFLELLGLILIVVGVIFVLWFCRRPLRRFFRKFRSYIKKTGKKIKKSIKKVKKNKK